MKTFRACVSVLETQRPEWFVLENVDFETENESEKSDTNLQLVLKALRDVGYNVEALHLIASDYGLPQRRARLYIVGYCDRRHSAADFQRLQRNLQKCRLRCQSPAPRQQNTSRFACASMFD